MVTGLQRTPDTKTAAVAIIEKKVILLVPIFCLLLWFVLLYLPNFPIFLFSNISTPLSYLNIKNDE
jgi:hypothetical protein